MNLFMRILLSVYAACLTFISIIAMSVSFKRDLLDRIYYYLSDDVLTHGYATVIMFTISLMFFVLSLTFLLSGIRSNKDKSAVSKHTNIGEIKISLNSLENIALGASRKLVGVKDTKAYVYRHNEGVSIIIKAVVLADINIPSLSEDIQIKVKNAVEDSSGIQVTEVKVMIENIYSGYKSRVE